MLSKKLSAVTLIALALCLYCAFAWKSRAAQEQRPINIKIEDFPQAYQNKEPVKIIGLYLGTTPVTSGEDFQADKDWLRDLRVMVKNVSDQPIKQIVLYLDIGERFIHMNWGRNYDVGRNAEIGPDLIVEPGGLTTIGYSAAEYSQMKNHLSQAHHLTISNKVTVSLRVAIFADLDKGWIAPMYVIRHGASWTADPEKPYTRPQSQDQGQARSDNCALSNSPVLCNMHRYLALHVPIGRRLRDQ